MLNRVLPLLCCWGWVLLAVPVQAGEPRERLSLDASWRFHLGDDWPNALRLDKAGVSRGPAAEKFNDTAWRALDLPHDWAVELPFDQAADGSHGFKPVGPAFPRTSVGWYRRTFELPAADAGRRIWIEFDGAFRDTTVWVNGWLVLRHEGGYYPFRADITDVVRPGGKNALAVRVDASRFEGWFYEGAGIYRHVWLEKTAPVALAPHGVFVSVHFPKAVPGNRAQVLVQTELSNAGTNLAKAEVRHEVLSPAGKPVGTAAERLSVQPLSTSAGKSVFSLAHPALWSPESPALYKLVTTVWVGGEVVDRSETEFGVRTVAFDPERGFMLNGQPYLLKGTCNHQDHAGVGAALPDRLQYFRIAKLKECGCNAYRCSHNPPTPELLDACDRLGMVVMDESRLLGSDPENLRKWEDLLRRDRNHPSVCIWSVANEEFSVQSSREGAQVARTMQALVQKLDPTCPVTYAAPEGDNFAGINGVIEVRGWNYHIGPDMDRYHARHPTQPNVGTEQGSTVSTRGIYANDPERGYVSAYDTNKTAWSNLAEEWWSYFADRPWLSGGFIWTGFDYRGEPTPYWWPCINSHFGILDTCGVPKDNFYYYQAWWTTNTVLHLLPHWNWPGREGQEIRVDALSNCQEVELLLNGASQGKKPMKRNSKLSWQVTYAPGTLLAKGYTGGRLVAEQKVETTGPAKALQLTADRATLNADGVDVSLITVSATDAQGRWVPVAQNKVHFALSGPGRMLGVGNGDPSCHEPDKFVPQSLVQAVPVNDWRWRLAALSPKDAVLPEYAPEFDDAAWQRLRPKTDGDTGAAVLRPGQTAVFRAHLTVTEEQLANPHVRLRFGGIDDQGWVFVNNQPVGESHDWSAQPVFDVRKALRPGDNVIAVRVQNDTGSGGLNPDVNLECIGQATPVDWSRSLFNGFAQVIVQSSADAGEIKLTATAEGLDPATVAVQTQPGPPRRLVR